MWRGEERRRRGLVVVLVGDHQDRQHHDEHAAEELAHALKISKQIDYLGGTPGVTPKPVKLSENPEELLRFDLENERETVAHYRERCRPQIGLLLVVTFDHDPVAGLDDRLEQFAGSLRWTDF